MKVYVLSARGYGDDEDAYFIIGVYGSKESLKEGMEEVKGDDPDVELSMEEWNVV